MPIIAAISAFLLSLIVTPIIIGFSHRFKWYDFHDQRKIHTGLISRLGGVGIGLSFLATVLCVPLILWLIYHESDVFLENVHYLYLLAGFLIMLITGLVDDFHNIRALKKLILQIIAAATVTAGGFLINSLTIPYIGTLNLGLFAYPLTIIWIVGISNAFNFIDGMDGFAGGIGAFAALSMGVIAIIQQQYNTALFALALFGSLAGFLLFNFPPAKIFMGDSGSLSAGFALSVIPLLGISRIASFGTLIIPVTLLTVPIVDTAAAILRRLRKQVPVYAPDKEHIHHKLLDLGLSERKILFVIYAMCFYFGIVSITSITLPKEMNVYLIIIVWTGSMLGYAFLNYFESRRVSTHSSSTRTSGGEEKNLKSNSKSDSESKSS